MNFKRAGLLAAIFILAVLGYYFLNINGKPTEAEVYTGMEEPELPVIWVNFGGRYINCMRAHKEDERPEYTDMLTPLDADRKLNLHIAESSVPISGLSYEIRSLDGEKLIEYTESEVPVSGEGNKDISIQVENIITENREYSLRINLLTEKGELRYYTRIRKGDNTLLNTMLDLAESFSGKNFNYDTARDNTVYLETDASADDSSLAKVNLKSSFKQLVYNNTGIEKIGDAEIYVKDYDGNMSRLSLNLDAGRDLEDGNIELYEIEESFTLRQGEERLYMMSYERSMNEVFLGADYELSGGRITLGINPESGIYSLESADKNFNAFVSSRDVFLFDKKENSLKKVFSFRSGVDSGIRSGYPGHDAKILGISNEGELSFAVYGYMNRGLHEGESGVAVYRYSSKENILRELKFIKFNAGFDEIRRGIETLCYLGSNNMLYIRLSDKIYGIDTSGGSYMIIADRPGSVAVSDSGNMLSWGEKSEGSESLSFMNLDTGEKKEINAEEGSLISPEGFIDSDLIVGVSDKEDRWILNGEETAFPYKTVNIMDFDLNIQKEYMREGYHLYDLDVSEGRIHLRLLRKDSGNSYDFVQEDTIVSNEPLKKYYKDRLGYYASENKGRVYYIEPEGGFAGGTKLSAVQDISIENVNMSGLEIKPYPGKRFIAFGGSGAVCISESAAEAIDAAYDKMGSVRYGGELIYSRAATPSSGGRRPAQEIINRYKSGDEAGLRLELRGLELKQLMYFVSKGVPVLGYSDTSEPLLIYAYDRYNISVYNLNTDESYKIGAGDAGAMFASGYNDFSCFFTFE